ncbi:MAG: anti-sigma factor [Flavobacterium sp.]|nr:anti-sigma factor [Flavobacterium sp.]
MEVNEFIASGILELFVFGKTTEAEHDEVIQMSKQHKEVQDEILSIEKAVISLSFSMSPYLSAENYDKIRKQLLDKHGVVEMKPTTNWGAYIGWAAAILLMIGIGFQYTQLNDTKNQVTTVQTEKVKLKGDLDKLDAEKKNAETVLAVVRDENNIVVPLGGQAVAPDAKAKIYWNKNTQVVYVDASGLPEPPEGKVYQIWSLTLNPLTPTSIGLLDNFAANNTKVFAVQSTTGAQAFGITLEPAGGSATPTMEQLYTLGAVKV